MTILPPKSPPPPRFEGFINDVKISEDIYISTNPLRSESRVSPNSVKTMSSGVAEPSLGHLFSKLDDWRPFEALTKKCENTKHISKILSHG